MSAPPSLTCPNCGSMPLAPNPATGGYFDYCSKTCATRARITGLNQGRPLDPLCEHCQRRPKFAAGTTAHRYCGRTCARLAANGYYNQTNPPSFAHPTPYQPTPPGQTCRTPRCTRPVFIHHDGTLSDYCTMTHKKWSEYGCISCRAAPRTSASVLCQPCYNNELRRAPAIIQVPEDHKNYKSIESQFKQSWRVTSPACPEVKAVYKIIVPQASLNQYQKYLDGVEARGNFVAMGKSRGNENRRWHGTRRKCNIGDPGNKTPCADSGCPLCCIIKTSFDLKFIGTATDMGWFGCGIYTSSTSSKSHAYSRNTGTHSDLKALLLNKVVVGYGKKMAQQDRTLKAPPPGYDSVLGEVADDEVVVYNNDAVRPSYLVMYKSP